MARAGSGVRRRDATRSLLGAHHLAEVSAHAPPGDDGLLRKHSQAARCRTDARRTLTPGGGAIRAVAGASAGRAALAEEGEPAVRRRRRRRRRSRRRREWRRQDATDPRRRTQGDRPRFCNTRTSSGRKARREGTNTRRRRLGCRRRRGQTLDATYSNPAGKSASSINITGVGSVPRDASDTMPRRPRRVSLRALWSDHAPTSDSTFIMPIVSIVRGAPRRVASTYQSTFDL